MAIAIEMGVTETNSQAQGVASAQFNTPFLGLQDTREARDIYLNLCVPLYKYAMKGNWAEAEPILLSYKGIFLNAAIAKQHLTVLHIAAGAGHVHFVKKLINLMHKDDLSLQDFNGNTAFSRASSVGNLQIVQIMLQKNSLLPVIRDNGGLTPLHSAALQGRNEMASYLYDKTVHIFEEDDWKKLFLTLINTGIYDLALKMLDHMETLALAENENGETGLHILAKRPLDLGRQKLEHQKRLMRSSGLKQTSVYLQLVRRLWKEILRLTNSVLEMRTIISYPSQLLFDAAEAGNFDFLAELISSYPDLIWELDDRFRSIIHIAVLHRHASIFNIIHDIGSNKDILVTFTDEDDGNNLLHLAAKLTPPDQLELFSGAAFQMMHELLWFKEVKKVMLPAYINKRNFKGITPSELFTMEHASLRKDAECWMKGTAKSCMLVSTVIATGVFTAAVNLPGGDNDTGTPNYLNTLAFLIFAMSDASALISSSLAILAFLSILVSRYAECDFRKSLPLKLIFGLVSLFISTASMMIAFSSSFFITYYHGTKWAPSFILVLSVLPIIIFLGLHYQLLFDIIYSTYRLRGVFRPNSHVLY